MSQTLFSASPCLCPRRCRTASKSYSLPSTCQTCESWNVDDTLEKQLKQYQAGQRSVSHVELSMYYLAFFSKKKQCYMWMWLKQDRNSPTSCLFLMEWRNWFFANFLCKTSKLDMRYLRYSDMNENSDWKFKDLNDIGQLTRHIIDAKSFLSENLNILPFKI